MPNRLSARARLARGPVQFLLLCALLLGLLPTAALAQDVSPLPAPTAEADAAGAADDESAAGVEEIAQPASVVEVLKSTRISPTVVNQVVRIFTSQDSFISSFQPNTNFGSSSSLLLGWDNTTFGAQRSVLQFNLSAIPANSRINSATYGIFQRRVTPSNDGNMDFRAQFMNSSWNESSITWNNANFLGGDSVPFGTIDPFTGWKFGNATDVIRAWTNGSRPNFGLLITGDETPNRNRTREFASRQANERPYIEVDFVASCDNLPPVVSVNALPQFVNSGFTVAWSGQDQAPSGCAPTGIAAWDIQYRVDFDVWINWRFNTTATSAFFDREIANGRTLQFRARAVDNAGNRSAFPGSQATTVVDTVAPTTSMAPLPDFTVQPNFVLNWSGADNISGVANYDVEFRIDDGGWQQLINATPLTSFTFTGAQDFTVYSFRVRARDNAGNVQAWPNAQAETIVVLGPISAVDEFVPNILKPTAPVTDTVTVNWVVFAAPGTTVTRIEVFYTYNNGPRTLFQAINNPQTNSVVFPWKQLGLGDGIYVFETIATNSLGQRERNNLELSASLIIDMSNAVQPAIYAPIIANNAR
jgi:hypothetical protein